MITIFVELFNAQKHWRSSWQEYLLFFFFIFSCLGFRICVVYLQFPNSLFNCSF